MSSATRCRPSTRGVPAGSTPADAERTTLGRSARTACGSGVVGAIAWRSLLTRFRTPRTALETFTGAGVGLAAVLVPTLTRDTVGSGAVLVGGAIQLAVLFMSGNSFGSDGPPVTHELLAGADLSDLVVRQGPQHRHRRLAAGGDRARCWRPTITGEWRFFVAGLGVGVGALFAGTGAADRAVGPGADRGARVGQPVRQRRVGQGHAGGAAAVPGARRLWRSPRCRWRWR